MTVGGMAFGFVGVYAIYSGPRGTSDNVLLVALMVSVWAGIANGADALGITWQRPSDAPTDGKHRWAVRLRIFMIVFGIACGATAMALFNPV